MKKILSVAALAMALLTSCEKDIDIDYHKVAPLYVVEASISNNGAVATVSRTINVQDTVWNEAVSNAVVTIVSDRGECFTLAPDGQGRYSAPEAIGVEGHAYTIKVRVGDYETEARSVMPKPVKVDSTFFYKVEMMKNDMICYRVEVFSDGTPDNYYYALLTRNGKPYKWQAADNRGFEGLGYTSLDMWCYYDSDQETNKDDIINDGDTIGIEVRRIDSTAYDYLLSLLLTEDSNSNPIPNFTNNALGYFSAYSSEKGTPTIYSRADVAPFQTRRSRR